MRRVLGLLAAALLVTAIVGPAAAAATPVTTTGLASDIDGSDSEIDGPAPGLDRTAATPTIAADSAPQIQPDDATPQIRPTDPAQTAETCNATSNDEIGYWEGICHNDDLDVDPSDGLSDEELTRVVYRGMARVEYVRNRSFNRTVPVETMTREEYTAMVTGNDSASGNGSVDGARSEFNRWNDQVWKALFIVGEDGSSEEAIQGTLSGSVAGFYSPAADRIVIVVPEGEEIRISEATLVHELTHAMQDQYHNLSRPRYVGATQDSDLAINGIVEGEASYVESRYGERCETGEWDCLPTPSEDGGGSSDGPENWGVFLTVFQPYSDGPAYVAEIVEEEGWSGVDERMEHPPNATAETIHREPRRPANITFTDTARNGWTTYPDQGVNGSDTAGEASMFTMFWYQNRNYGADTFDWRATLTDTSHPESVYNYDHPSTAGWAGDRLFPYRNDRGATDRNGYVWVTEWRTALDAAQFHATYRQVLAAHDAVHREDGTRYVADGGFSGAYAIERNGTRVTIVHAPDSDAVFDLRPAIDPVKPIDGGETVTPLSPTIPDDGTPTVEPATSEEETDPTAEETPGFGIAAAIAAIAALTATALLARRRRE